MVWFTLQVTIVIKYFFQFGFFPFNQNKIDKNKPYHPPNIIGVEKKDGYVHYDLVQLLALFFHRSILKVPPNHSHSFSSFHNKKKKSPKAALNTQVMTTIEWAVFLLNLRPIYDVVFTIQCFLFQCHGLWDEDDPKEKKEPSRQSESEDEGKGKLDSDKESEPGSSLISETKGSARTLKSINFGTSIDSGHVQIHFPQPETYQRRKSSSGGSHISHRSLRSSARSKRGEDGWLLTSGEQIAPPRKQHNVPVFGLLRNRQTDFFTVRRESCKDQKYFISHFCCLAVGWQMIYI